MNAADSLRRQAGGQRHPAAAVPGRAVQPLHRRAAGGGHRQLRPVDRLHLPQHGRLGSVRSGDAQQAHALHDGRGMPAARGLVRMFGKVDLDRLHDVHKAFIELTNRSVGKECHNREREGAPTSPSSWSSCPSRSRAAPASRASTPSRARSGCGQIPIRWRWHHRHRRRLPRVLRHHAGAAQARDRRQDPRHLRRRQRAEGDGPGAQARGRRRLRQGDPLHLRASSRRRAILAGRSSRTSA